MLQRTNKQPVTSGAKYAADPAQSDRLYPKEHAMINNLNEFQKLGQVNLEAPMKAIADWQKGMQTLATEVATYSKRSFEDSTKTFEKLLSVKSLDQAVEIQTSYAKRAYEDYMAQLNKLGGMYGEFAKEATKPLAGLMQPVR